MDKYSCRDAIEQIALYIDPVESALGSLLADAKEGVGQYSPPSSNTPPRSSGASSPTRR